MTKTPVTVSVYGLGNWGTALAQHLAQEGNPVLAWTHDPAIAEGVNRGHSNPKYQSHVPLHPGLRATTDINELAAHSFHLLVLPSAALAEVLPRIKIAPESVLISGIKGFEGESGATPLQCASALLNPLPRLAVISGPGFASDVIIQRPSGLVAACADERIAAEVAELFTSAAMRVYSSTDTLGVELGGIVKNIIALAAGVVDGLNLGDSARAGLITRGLAEMMRLAEVMGARQQTLAGLSGLGDLVLTATCDASRNRTVGIRLGRGETLQGILSSLGSTAEGVRSAPTLAALAERYALELPITQAVNRLLKAEVSPQEMVSKLLARPMRSEF